MDFVKGNMYMLKGMNNNKRYNRMIDWDGDLWISDAQSSYSTNKARYRDGDIFVCIEGSREFDKALAYAEYAEKDAQAGIEGRDADYAVERAHSAHERARVVRFLTPSGTVVHMRVKGNKTKFKKVTSRTRTK